MKVVEELMEVAASDTELLAAMDAKGDQFSTSRDVDFLLLAPDQARAELVASFINDYHFGRASVQQNDGAFSILAKPRKDEGAAKESRHAKSEGTAKKI